MILSAQGILKPDLHFTFNFNNTIQFSSVQSLSHVRLFATPRIAARQASLSITIPEFTQTHVHRVRDAIQPSHSGVISPLISSSILGTSWCGELLFWYPIILPFHTVHGVLKARALKWLAIPFSSGENTCGSVNTLSPFLWLCIPLEECVYSIRGIFFLSLPLWLTPPHAEVLKLWYPPPPLT